MKNTLKSTVLVILILLMMSCPVIAKGNDIQIKINHFGKWAEINQNRLGKEQLSNDKPGYIHVMDNRLYYYNLYNNTMKEMEKPL